MGRLLLFALLSEVPYDLALSGRLLDMSGQNVMFSLAAGLTALWLLERAGRRPGTGAAYALILGCGEPRRSFLRLDYGFAGILTMGVMYLGRDRRWVRLPPCACWSLTRGVSHIFRGNCRGACRLPLRREAWSARFKMAVLLVLPGASPGAGAGVPVAARMKGL